MMMKKRDEWMNKEALQRDVKVIVEMIEKTEEVEDFLKYRE